MLRTFGDRAKVMAAIRWVLAVTLLGLGSVLCAPVLAGTAPAAEVLPPGLIVPDASRPGPGFDIDTATAAYVDLLSPAQRARSDAYFEGGYWLQCWNLLYTLALAALLLFSGISRRMADRARGISSRPFVFTSLYVAMYFGLTFVLSLPLTIYQEYFREHQYALSTQTFGAWSGDAVKALLIAIVIASPLIALLYTAVRRVGARWWQWATAGAGVTMVIMIMLAPVVIAPLFNEYTLMPEGPVRDQVLSLARAFQIPADNVYVVDASRQSTRIGANVSGLFGTTRISLNDNLLNHTSAEEIKAVMGHEMGHYVLNHALRFVIYFSLILALGFWLVERVMARALHVWGARWGVRDRGDPAGLPLAVAILAVFMTVITPLTNTVVRQAEAEADAFGLAAAGEPHGFATVAMRLSTYRKIHPGALEEGWFYDHPSGHTRVQGAMAWLAENQDDPRVERAVMAASD